ncbi:hypothetical protein BDL97_06G092000 [Sphagnum fallax]|nr:hypothetical protein BDL97_06G092000 [Sphagnum fallax]
MASSSSSSWPRFLFPNPNSFITALDVVVLLTGVYLAYNEYSGMGLQYSKFAVAGLHERNQQKSKQKKKEKVFQFKSKTGMLLFYAPADCIAILFLAYSLSCYIVAGQLPMFLHALTELPGIATSHLKQYCTSDFDYRLLAVAAAFSIHFSKRVLEVLFLHRFSGTTGGWDTFKISMLYAIVVGSLLCTQVLSFSLPGTSSPTIDLKGLGVSLFLLGICGNFYHHYLLSCLREDGNNKNKYVVPHGGLFKLLVCPHYVFEIIDFIGMATISQTILGFCCTFFVVVYLTGRTSQTKKWYAKKVEGFPQDRKILIPKVY